MTGGGAAVARQPSTPSGSDTGVQGAAAVLRPCGWWRTKACSSPSAKTEGAICRGVAVDAGWGGIEEVAGGVFGDPFKDVRHRRSLVAALPPL